MNQMQSCVCVQVFIIIEFHFLLWVRLVFCQWVWNFVCIILLVGFAVFCQSFVPYKVDPAISLR